ncbi:hypothetical protein FRB99_006981 [Tulasnella sp. 403]|nr:hypothetical protein FRB99_006981 [Tulasnella sp. 403]
MPDKTFASDSMDIDPPTIHQPSTYLDQGQHPTQTRPNSSAFLNSNNSIPRFASNSTVEQGLQGPSSSSEAGPSQLPFYVLASRTYRPPTSTLEARSIMFLIPPHNFTGQGPPHLRLRLHPTQDLVSRLGLLPAFNQLVRPYIRVPGIDGSVPGSVGDEKGKGKEVDTAGHMQGVELPDGATAAAVNGKLDGVQGEKKKEHEKGWKSFVAAVNVRRSARFSGKFSTKKDTYLGDLVSYPPRARQELRKFDTATLNGFRLEEGQLDAATLQQLGLGPDSEKKKHKKKVKKLPDGSIVPTSAAISPSATSSHQLPPAQTPLSARPQSAHSVNHSGSPYPQSNRPPTQAQSPHPNQNRQVNGSAHAAPNGVPDGNLWRGQVVPSGGLNGIHPTTSGASMGAKATKVRKDREEGTTASGAQGQAMSPTGSGGAPRPHKKRKTEGHAPQAGAPPQHHLPHHKQQPMQQATPTF